MKRCSRCGETKPLDDFHRKARAGDGRQGMCKPCNIAQRMVYYNTPEGRASHKLCGKRGRQRVQAAVLAYLLLHPCVDCGEADPIVLEFDHRDPTLKAFSVAQGVSNGKGIRLIMEEIAKCDVRCANCHRRRTAHQFGWHSVRVEGFEPTTNPECKPGALPLS